MLERKTWTGERFVNGREKGQKSEREKSKGKVKKYKTINERKKDENLKES